MTPTVEDLKNEISEYYIKDFKKQIGWFESIAVLPIQKPIKNILIGKAEMPEKFNEVKEFGWRKDIINFVSPQLANEIFEFMKSKRLEIEKRKTESELIDLKNEILGLIPETTPPVQNPQSSTQTGSGSSTADNPGGNNDGKSDEDPSSNIDPENGKDQNSGSQELQESHGTNGIRAGLETGLIGGSGTYALEKIAASNARATEQAIEQLSPEKMKSTIEGVIEATRNKRDALRSRLTEKQFKTVSKQLDDLGDALKSCSDANAVDLLKDWNRLGDKLKVSRALLQDCGLTVGELRKISNIAGDLVGQSASEVKNILKAHGITNIDDNIVEALCKAGSASDITSMTKILRNGRQINRTLQTLAGALWVDLAFTGIDVWMLIEQRNEAELISKVNELRGKNKYSQAWTQFGIGISSVALEGLLIRAIGAAATGGVVGMAVGLGVGALTWAASVGVDEFYFDVKDFYLQTQEDFLRKTRAQLKQAILQGIYNYKNGNTSINERFTTYRNDHHLGLNFIFGDNPSLKPGSETKVKSLNDACASMILLEEIDSGGQFADNKLLREYVQSGKTREDFLSEKDKDYKNEFEQVWKQMEDRINDRMTYILKEFEKPDIIESINKGTGMQDLTHMFTYSRVVVELKKLNEWDDSKPFEDNLQSYKTKFFSEFPAEKVQQFENLRETDPSLFLEIITTVSEKSFIYGEEDEEKNEDSNYVENVKMVAAYQKRLELTESVEDERYLNIEKYNAKFIENLLISDFDLSKVEYPNLKPETVIAIVGCKGERNGLTDISDDPLQNVLYRLARELFGYSGGNNMQGLMGFFSEAKDDNHGLYYSRKRKINKDRAIDKKLKKLIPDEFQKKDIDGIIETFISENKIGESSIDMPTESIDNQLNLEFKNKFESLLREELLARTIENKNDTKNKISDFIKQHSDGKYIELPYFLILEAKRSGLGDLQRQFFNRENNKMEICYLPSELNQTSLFDDAEKSYISPARESFTEEEQYYIDRVEVARKKIEAIRSAPDGLGDDLNIPIEIEYLLSEKVNEREKFKQDMLLYGAGAVTVSPTVDKESVYLKYEDFASYFENLYKGMLISLMGFKVTNNINSFALFSQSLYYGNQSLFDESGNLLTIEGNKLINDTEFKKFYDEQIKTLKIGSQTIKELWESDDPKERELARQASNAIYVTVLEACLIDFDGMGNVTRIHIGNGVYFDKKYLNYGVNGQLATRQDEGSSRMDKRYTYKEDITANLITRFEKMQIAPEISQDKVKELLKPQEIKKLTQQEKEVTNTTPEVQKIIEGTMKNVDWRYKRGQIKFDIKTSTLKSWNHETKIILPKDGSIEKIHLDGLDWDLSLEEGLRLANFRNYIKSEFPNGKVEFGIDIINMWGIMGFFSGSFTRGKIMSESWRKTLKINGKMLLLRSDFIKYCSICESDEVMEKIAEWLNKISLREGWSYGKKSQNG